MLLAISGRLFDTEKAIHHIHREFQSRHTSFVFELHIWMSSSGVWYWRGPQGLANCGSAHDLLRMMKLPQDVMAEIVTAAGLETE